MCVHAGIAKIVLDNCVVENYETNSKEAERTPSRDNSDYQVIFNYEFLEDYKNGWCVSVCVTASLYSITHNL